MKLEDARALFAPGAAPEPQTGKALWPERYSWEDIKLRFDWAHSWAQEYQQEPAPRDDGPPVGFFQPSLMKAMRADISMRTIKPRARRL